MEYILVSNKEKLPAIQHLKPFKCVLVVEETVAPSRQAEISEWLVESGCLYMMAWGQNCHSWDTSVDLANIDQFGGKEIPDESFVMTTWHEDESLDEVFWFAKHAAHHDTQELKNVAILHLSSVNKLKQFESEYSNT